MATPCLECSVQTMPRQEASEESEMTKMKKNKTKTEVEVNYNLSDDNTLVTVIIRCDSGLKLDHVISSLEAIAEQLIDTVTE